MYILLKKNIYIILYHEHKTSYEYKESNINSKVCQWYKHEFKVYSFCVIKLYLYDVSKKYFRKKIIYRQIQIEIVFLCTFENF